MESKKEGRQRRRVRIRKKVYGTPERLRLSVYKSLNNTYAQVIDDLKGHTIVSASSIDKEFRDDKSHKGNIHTAKKVGQLIAAKAIGKGIKKVVFDRGGYLYHGRVKALADAAREAGLEF